MFNSQYDVKLDPKGRLVLPSKIKGAIPEANGTTLMLRMAENRCLALYPMVEYKKLESQIKALNINNPEHRLLQRSFFSSIVEVELDNTGRVLIPKLYQTYASLEKDVVVVGMGVRIELWSPDKYLENVILDPEVISAQMEKLLS